MKTNLIKLASISLLLSSCVKEEKMVEVEILSIDQHPSQEAGWITLIEDEDGMRERINGKLGEVGDKFKIKRIQQGVIQVGKTYQYDQ